MPVLPLVHVDDIGRVYLPVAARNWLGVKKGDSLAVVKAGLILTHFGRLNFAPPLARSSTVARHTREPRSRSHGVSGLKRHEKRQEE